MVFARLPDFGLERRQIGMVFQGLPECRLFLHPIQDLIDRHAGVRLHPNRFAAITDVMVALGTVPSVACAQRLEHDRPLAVRTVFDVPLDNASTGGMDRARTLRHIRLG